MRNAKRYISLALAGVLVVSMLAGCGNNQKNKDKDTLTVAITGDPPTLDPHSSSTSSSVNNLNPVYETLVRYDENGEITPCLATEWERTDDYHWRFKLRDDVTFHNGEKMTADDVLFSFQRATGPDGAKVAYIMSAIDSENCVVEDDYTIVIATHEPFAPLIGYLPYIGAVVVSEKEFTENPEKAALNPVGTGPFRFVEWKKNDRCTYVRNDDYWGQKPSYKNLVIRTIVEANSRVIELESGSVDIVFEVPANDVVRLKENEDTDVAERLSTVVEFLDINVKVKPLDDVRVRQAIDYAINEQAIVDLVWRGNAAYSPTTVTPNMKYFDDSDTDYRYDVEKAKALLKEAGVSDLTLTLTCAENTNRLNAATIIQSMLADVGITVQIQSYESGTFYDMVEAGELELFIVGFGAVGFPEPDNNIYGPYHSKQIPTNNMGFYKDPELDAMLDQQRATSDGPEREQTVKDIQKYLRENVPVVPIANTKQVIGIRSNIKGFVPTPAASHFFDKVQIE
ncbi:MAG: ABC transporter substrate-binding protein [Dorea sp.]|jgi:peptide/nickel transport system substrate-binding protein|nr:ABC transporter substrate-binding protein [Dorea sp.]